MKNDLRPEEAEDEEKRNPVGIVAAQPMMVQQPMVVQQPMMVQQPMVAAQPVRPPVVWMPAPDQLLEVFTGIKTANRYVIRNAMGQQIYYAMELSTQGQRSYNGAWRAFTMRITDNSMRVIRIHRPAEPCCDYAKCFVESPPGVPIGYVKGSFDRFKVADPMRVPFLSVIQPGYIDKNTQTVFAINSANGQSIGMIVKHFGGIMKEAMTNADTFSLHFPMDLTAQMKAILIACVFMIDFRHFEDKHSSYGNSYNTVY